MESHQTFAANLSTKWSLHQVGMEQGLGGFLWAIPAPLCLVVPFEGDKGKSPVSSCTDEVRKYSIPAPGFAESETSCSEQDKKPRPADVCRRPWAPCKTSCCPLLCKATGTNTAHQSRRWANSPISASIASGTSFRI